MKFIYLFILFIVSFFNVYAQVEVELLQPTNKAEIATNMPVLSWKSVVCDKYELWIDNVFMDSISHNRNSYTVFPLSFGKHTWKIITVKGALRSESKAYTFDVQDKTLSILPVNALLLRNNWKMISSVSVGKNGSKISTNKVDTKSWNTTSIPSTVLTALVRNGVYPNPYISKNNMLIPDCNNAYNEKYNLLKYSHIKDQNPWKEPYWFRCEFSIPKEYSNKSIWLNFNEINYKAEVWLNGKRIADTTAMVGMERQFQFDVTSKLKKTGTNSLAVLIYPPSNPGEPAIEPLTPLSDPGQNMGNGYISHDYTKWDVMGWDWQPPVRDRDMGITEEVFLSASDAILIDNLYVSSDIPLPDTTKADVTVSFDLINHSNSIQNGKLNLQIVYDNQLITISEDYTLAPNEIKTFLLDKNKYTQLLISNPKLWWPVGYGLPNLYTLKIDAGKATKEIKFGIRKVETYIGSKERVYNVNGKQIYCKGGNWVIDMMLNWTAQRYESEILLTKNANLNMLRIWGPTGIAPEALYNAADKYGILIWQDFLNDFWGTYKNTPGYQPEISLFEKATIGIVKRYRNHPSLIIWCGGNEGPNPREELITKSILAKYDNRDSRHYLKQSDGDGLHGGGPYHTLEPKDYFSHPKLTGFSSEIGPSGIPVIESLKMFIDDLGKNWGAGRYPINGTWAYHDANDWPGEDSRKFTAYDNMLRNYYDGADSSSSNGVEDYVAKCQLINYDVYRASIESINRQLWTTSSGVLLWKSNSSWPSLTWQIYDWYLQAHAGYYGTKKAAEPIHIQLNRDNNSVSLINNSSSKLINTLIKAELFDINMNKYWHADSIININENSSTYTGWKIPVPDSLVFLKLSMYNADKEFITDNFYWLNSKNKYQKLNSLSNAEIKADVVTDIENGRQIFKLKILNIGKTIAFMIDAKLLDDKSKNEILPSLWSDNYISLLPNESKTIRVELPYSSMSDKPVIQLKAFNMTKAQIVQTH